MAAPFSAIIMVGELVLPEVLVCHAEPSLAATRETLLLARFAEIHRAREYVLLAWKRQADARGIAASV
jgi:hypothetical protein